MRLTVLTDLSCMFPLLILSIISLMAFAIGSLGAAAERLFVIEWIWVGTPEPNSSNTISALPTLKTRGTLGRVNFRKRLLGLLQATREKKWPIADRRFLSNDPTNHCGTHFSFNSLLFSKVAKANKFIDRSTTEGRNCFGFLPESGCQNEIMWLDDIILSGE